MEQQQQLVAAMSEAVALLRRPCLPTPAQLNKETTTQSSSLATSSGNSWAAVNMGSIVLTGTTTTSSGSAGSSTTSGGTGRHMSTTRSTTLFVRRGWQSRTRRYLDRAGLRAAADRGEFQHGILLRHLHGRAVAWCGVQLGADDGNHDCSFAIAAELDGGKRTAGLLAHKHVTATNIGLLQTVGAQFGTVGLACPHNLECGGLRMCSRQLPADLGL